MKKEGYIYCISNESMPGIYKIGMTERSPEIRLDEANKSDTWRPPTRYKIEFAKKVKNPKQKETSLHEILKKDRVTPNREFFRVSITEVLELFKFLDGEVWINDNPDEDYESYFTEEM
jgi:hypothetical protein